MTSEISEILALIDERATDLNKKSTAIDIENRSGWFHFAYARDELRVLACEIKQKYKIYPYGPDRGGGES